MAGETTKEEQRHFRRDTVVICVGSSSKPMYRNMICAYHAVFFHPLCTLWNQGCKMQTVWIVIEVRWDEDATTSCLFINSLCIGCNTIHVNLTEAKWRSFSTDDTRARWLRMGVVRAPQDRSQTQSNRLRTLKPNPRVTHFVDNVTNKRHLANCLLHDAWTGACEIIFSEWQACFRTRRITEAQIAKVRILNEKNENHHINVLKMHHNVID